MFFRGKAYLGKDYISFVIFMNRLPAKPYVAVSCEHGCVGVHLFWRRCI